MSDIRQARRLELALRELVVIDDACEQFIRCECGELWLTQDGDSRDVILQPGDDWRVGRHQPVVISALKPSVLRIVATSGCATVARPCRRGAELILTRILRWRFPALASFPATHIL
jgi:hypothetical protein